MMPLKKRQVKRQNKYNGFLLLFVMILISVSCNQQKTMDNTSEPVYDYEQHFLLLESDKLKEYCDSVEKFDNYKTDLIQSLVNNIDDDYNDLVSMNNNSSISSYFSKQSRIDNAYIKQCFEIKKHELQNALSMNDRDISSEDIQRHSIDFYKKKCSLANDTYSWLLNHDLLLSYDFQIKYLTDFSNMVSNRFLQSNGSLARVDILPKVLIFKQKEKFPQINLFFKISPLYCSKMLVKLRLDLTNEPDSNMKDELSLWIKIFSAVSTENATLLVY